MNAIVTEKCPQAALDIDNHRFVVAPLKNGGLMDVPSCFRSIRKHTTTKWRELAERTGLRDASQAFKVAYTRGFCNRVVPDLNNFLVIDSSADRAYLYFHDHRPETVTPKHTGPGVLNNEAATITVAALIPTKITSRLTITDPLNRILTMTLEVEGGYLLGVNDFNICQPNAKYVISGSVNSLNQLLRQIHFVGMTEGAGSIIVAVDDGAGEVASVAATSVKLVITAAETVSVPEIILPEDVTVILNQVSAFAPITVSDTDGKLMEFRITPFGCELFGFKNYLQPVVYGEVRKIYGRPETINADLANVKVRALQSNAQIGMELVCGTTTIRQYLAFTVETPEIVQPATVVEENVTVTPPAPEPAPTEPSLGTAAITVEKSLTGTVNEAELFDIKFSGDRTVAFNVVITPTNCSLTGFVPDAGIVTEAHTFSGTIAQLNNVFASLEVTPLDTTGSISIAFPGTDGVITTETVSVSAIAGS